MNIYPVLLLFFDTTRPHQRMKKGKKTRRVSRQHSNRTQKKEIKREKEKSPPVSFFFSKRNNTHGHFVRRRGERFGVQNGAAGISPDWLRFHSHVAGAEWIDKKKRKEDQLKDSYGALVCRDPYLLFLHFSIRTEKGEEEREKKQEGKRVGQQSRVETQSTIYQNRANRSAKNPKEETRYRSKQLSPPSPSIYFSYFFIYIYFFLQGISSFSHGFYP